MAARSSKSITVINIYKCFSLKKEFIALEWVVYRFIYDFSPSWYLPHQYCSIRFTCLLGKHIWNIIGMINMPKKCLQFPAKSLSNLVFMLICFVYVCVSWSIHRAQTCAQQSIMIIFWMSLWYMRRLFWFYRKFRCSFFLS